MNIVAKLVLLFTVTGFIFQSAAAGEKGPLRWRSFDQGVTEAKKAKKKILVDVFTDWCGWCKKMDRDVYANVEVAQYLSRNFVVIKLDAESGAELQYDNRTLSEMEFAQGFGVTGYPTTLFLKSNGEAITSVPGYIPSDTFIKILKFIGEDHYLTMRWEEYNSR